MKNVAQRFSFKKMTHKIILWTRFGYYNIRTLMKTVESNHRNYKTQLERSKSMDWKLKPSLSCGHYSLFQLLITRTLTFDNRFPHQIGIFHY